MKDISLRKFASMVGVSPATVSRVFSSPDAVAPETVKRVSEMAQTMGFSPSAVSRAAFGCPTRSIGVILSRMCNHYFGGIAKTMQDHLIEAGYLPIFLTAPDHAEQAIVRLLKHKVDLLVVGISDEHLNISDICRRQMMRLPVVVLDHARPGLWADSVLNDDYDGGRQAAEHFISLGHRSFGALVYGEGTGNAEQRLKGFQETLLRHGLSLPAANLVRQKVNVEETIRLTVLDTDITNLLKRSAPPTAFFCANDYLALSLYDVAEKLGIRIPEEIQVIGFGNLEFGRHLHPALTTLRQDPERIGRETARLVLQRLEQPEVAPESILVPVQLVIRNSTQKKGVFRNEKSAE